MSETVIDLQTLPALNDENEGGGGGGSSCNTLSVICCTQFSVCGHTI